MFSFIIPVYNMEHYIRQCVDSIVLQNIEDCEIILINDGSKDESGAICDSLANDYSFVKVFHKRNQGVSLARKDGLKIATGEYVIFLDCDDWVSPDFIGTLKTIIKSTPADYICYGVFNETRDHQFVESYPQITPGLYQKEDLEKYIFPYLVMDERGKQFKRGLNGKCFKRELCNNYMIEDPAATMGEDTSVSVACLANCKSAYFIDKCLSYYRYNENSATKGHKIFNWDNPEACNKFIENNIPIDKFDFKSQLFRKTAYDISSVVVTRFYQSKSYREIIKEIKSYLKLPYYKQAIESARFKGINRLSFMHFALKHNLFFLFYLYSKIKD